MPLSALARRMGGANGSRECAPDDKLRDTHQLPFAKMMGFARGLNPSYLLIAQTAIDVSISEWSARFRSALVRPSRSSFSSAVSAR